jgi:hypothetical protein
MADVQTAAQAAQDDKPLFTCLSCLIAFLTAEEQRTILFYISHSDRTDAFQGITIAPTTIGIT